MKINGEEIIFLRSNGELAINAIMQRGTSVSSDGEIHFLEVIDSVKPTINGKRLFHRILVQRVYPHIVRTKKTTKEGDIE